MLFPVPVWSGFWLFVLYVCNVVIYQIFIDSYLGIVKFGATLPVCYVKL